MHRWALAIGMRNAAGDDGCASRTCFAFFAALVSSRCKKPRLFRLPHHVADCRPWTGFVQHAYELSVRRS